MSRTYSTQLCAIWNDPGFRALSSVARDTYFMLTTQPEIDAAGCMALTIRRWAKLVSGVADGLLELANAGLVVMDEDTEEVLAVPFAESDGGYKHSKRVHAVVAAANAIRSDSLKRAAWKELSRLGVQNRERPDSHPSANPDPVDSATDGLELVGSREHPSSHNPHEGAPPSDEPSPFCSKHPRGTETACAACGTAKLVYARWTKAEPQRKAAAAALKANCRSCHGSGWLEDDAGRPLDQCDHRQAVAS